MNTSQAIWQRARAGISSDQGNSPLVQAMVVPAVLVLALLAIQTAFLFHARTVAQAAAQQGVDAARAYGASPADGQARALDFMSRAASDGLLTDRQVAVTGSGNLVTVSVTATPMSLLPSSWVRFTVRSSGPAEEFTR